MYISKIYKDKQCYYLGEFTNAKDAAREYNK